MIQRLRLIHILVALILLTNFVAAWPWPPTMQNIEGLIFRRNAAADDSEGSSGSSSSQPTKTQATKSNTASEKASQTKHSTAKSDATEKTTISTKPSKTTEGSSKTSAIDDRSPPGGVAMITPVVNAPVPEYYKIGDYVEFAWNYTSLLAKPTAVDVLVSCSANQATYTLQSNATFQPTGKVIWNTSAEESGSAPLLTESYTLIIHDVDADVTENAEPGRLAAYNQFHFGMYRKQTYTPRNEWVCATCSSALSDMERQTLKFVFGMGAITVLSFTWFAGGFGVLF